jgi:hypothetical protein
LQYVGSRAIACSSPNTAVADSKLFLHLRRLSFGPGGTIAKGGINVTLAVAIFSFEDKL